MHGADCRIGYPLGITQDNFYDVNAELMKQALAKVGNPHVLVNLISRRVRQMNAGGGLGRPLVDVPPGTGAADAAMTEVIEGKITWEYVNEPPTE